MTSHFSASDQSHLIIYKVQRLCLQVRFTIWLQTCMTLMALMTQSKFFHGAQTAKQDFNQADDADASEKTQGAT